MTRISYDAGVARSPDLEEAIHAGLRATQTAETHIILTRDIDESVRRQRPDSSWSAYRGSGATFAKTLGEPPDTVLLNLLLIEREENPLNLAERLVAHESCHMQMGQRQESMKYHHDLAQSQVEFDLISIADGMLEEYRCELTVVRELGYPVLLRHEVADLVPVLAGINADFVRAITEPGSSDVSILRDRVTGIAGQLLKHLAVTSAGAAHLDGNLHPVARKASPHDWSDYVAPIWRPLQGLLRSAPPASTPWPRDQYRATLRSSMQFADRFLRNLGYAYTGAGPGSRAFGFRRVAPDGLFDERVARAEQSRLQEATNRCD